MMWYIAKPYDSQYISRRHEAFQAPSWSWASVTGPATYYHRDMDKDNRNGELEITKSAEREDFSLLLCANEKRAKLIPFPEDLLGYMTGYKSNVGWEVKVIHKGKVAKLYPDVAGRGTEIDIEETHYFLLILKTTTLFAALILRKSRFNKASSSDPMHLERVGFCCDNAQGLGLREDYSASKETQFEKLLKLFDSLPGKHIVFY
ncbi:hypothetical protein BDZ45DRAFT_805757 [Acephala macrosclerotiorum]|nr:hypothetical protein BDZ45DRAFT_805757 [Acephala macrosclerotiorum]